uniref:Uncharacterized protein n=1 Tax=Octopus bimaculoides TaxID=37653 RepID=A0A0L8I093_OCTBM
MFLRVSVYVCKQVCTYELMLLTIHVEHRSKTPRNKKKNKIVKYDDLINPEKCCNKLICMLTFYYLRVTLHNKLEVISIFLNNVRKLI